MAANHTQRVVGSEIRRVSANLLSRIRVAAHDTGASTTLGDLEKQITHITTHLEELKRTVQMQRELFERNL